jgi:hypothetical protein
MLDQLTLAEQQLPYLLTKPELWQSLFVNYEKPHVERVWCPWGDYRINLHRILPCQAEETFFHPHPWPSAMKILGGTYQMLIGYGSGLQEPPISTTCNLTAGSTYEMVDPDSWHSVRPLDRPVWSVMLTGKPWGREMPKSDQIRLSCLEDSKVKEILTFFKGYYFVQICEPMFLNVLLQDRKVTIDLMNSREKEPIKVLSVLISGNSATSELRQGDHITATAIPALHSYGWSMDNIGYLLDWLENVERDAFNYDADRIEIHALGNWKV